MAQEMIAGVARLSGPASSLNMAQLLFEGEARRPTLESNFRLIRVGSCWMIWVDSGKFVRKEITTTTTAPHSSKCSPYTIYPILKFHVYCSR